MGEVVADEALLNPGLVLIEGAGATWGGSGGEISCLAVAADGGGSNVERVCGFLEGVIPFMICLCPTLRMTHDHPTLIKEAPSELLEHERRHRHSITGSRIRMLRLLKRGEAKGVREAGELIGYSWRHTRRWLTTY